jgi:hypothetical protein
MTVEATLRGRMVDAYGTHVRSRLGAIGLGAEVDDEMEAAIAAGERWLDEHLDALLGLPFAQQARGPLEVFQEAMRFPTQVLQSRGLEAPARDEVARNALPGDTYDLAPASSNLLGDEVWAAHLAWGAAKAQSLG